MATIDALAGLALARTKSTNRAGYCFAEVSAAYDNPHVVGPWVNGFANAIDGWTAATLRHEDDRNPPIGVPVWFGKSPTRTDRNKNAGDVAISMGGGLLWCTDASRAGVPGIMTIAAREKQTARPYLGWTGDYLGNTLVNIGAVVPPTTTAGSVTFHEIVPVKTYQARLIALGYNLGATGADGVKGKLTRAAIHALQVARKLKPDELVGPLTWGAMNPPAARPASGHPILKRGSKGAAVGVWQSYLKAHYPLYAGKLKVDNDFGKNTEAVTEEWQRRSGLDPDGVVGGKSWGKSGL